MVEGEWGLILRKKHKNVTFDFTSSHRELFNLFTDREREREREIEIEYSS